MKGFAPAKKLFLLGFLFCLLFYTLLGVSAYAQNTPDPPTRQTIPSNLKVEPLSDKINTAENQFGISIAKNGTVLYYYSRKDKGVYTSIYRSEKINDDWTLGTEVSELNSPYDDQSPFISSDEKTIFFSSNRDGSVEFQLNNGKIGVSRDIYISFFENGHWLPPVSVSPNINSYLIEENPFLVDSQLLFVRYPFGEPMKADIYLSQYNGQEWEAPRKLPAPVNSDYSDIAPSVSADRKLLYFASNRPGGYGGYDIYASEIKEDGTLGEAINLGAPINSEGDEAFLVGSADGNQFFFCRRKESKNHDIYVLNKTAGIAETLDKEKKLSLNSIHFEAGKHNLSQKDIPVLDEIFDYLKKHPRLKMKITGHTDLNGRQDLNLQLSQERADEVKKYLTDKGIHKNRIFTEGKGSQEPLYPTSNPDTDWYNRRTEFKILEN